MINNTDIFNKAYAELKAVYGPDAKFRNGQYEAIEETMTRKRVLIVQRTGWGKSLVYFICTKLMRQENKGVTMVVSPLLALMNNQLEAAHKLGLKCDALNSETKERQTQILQEIKDGKLDLVLVTPETLFTNEVQKELKDFKIGLFVIDEAHCISDWGHDFRLEYGNLKQVISTLPENVPILATTATANDRVIEDLEKQLGGNVFISRGPLTRDSLSIQILNMPDRATRYAWILENINKLPGSGIIYCLTKKDCCLLRNFLVDKQIKAEAYYSRNGALGNKKNREIEEKFQRNEIKAIVATTKLGMGYDKGDIGFVIHYQMPKNIISYYQQIGRAGRNIDRAYAILMYGKEDETILNNFIKKAFPGKDDTTAVMNYIQSKDGLNMYQIYRHFNMKKNYIDKIMAFLVNDGFVRKIKLDAPKANDVYYSTAKKFVYNQNHYDAVTMARIMETEQIKSLADTKECYSKYIVEKLDDHSAKNCGHCANCLGKNLLPSTVSTETIKSVNDYLENRIIKIYPLKKWNGFSPDAKNTGRNFFELTVNEIMTSQNCYILYQNKEGICLSKYGEPGYGEMVQRDKYYGSNRFCDELLSKSVKVLRPFIKEHGISHITCVPSLRSNIVADFSKRLAGALGIEFVELLKKSEAAQQKEMQNDAHQCENAMKSNKLIRGIPIPEKILLVDDIVDSGWTLAACGYYLGTGGCKEVYPFALADSSESED